MEPLVDAIGRHVLKEKAIFAGETPFKMQSPGKGRCKTARMWTYVRDERPWLVPCQASPLPVGPRRFGAWLHAHWTKNSGKSKLAKALCYALARMKKLRPYLNQGILKADNSSAERAMKLIALGRKNFLVVGFEGGGKSAAIALTLIETARFSTHSQ